MVQIEMVKIEMVEIDKDGTDVQIYRDGTDGWIEIEIVQIDG